MSNPGKFLSAVALVAAFSFVVVIVAFARPASGSGCYLASQCGTSDHAR
jgi:hypothetical protein